MTWQISANDRDAWDDSNNGDIDSCYFSDSLWSDAGGYQWAVTIPQGTTINSAKVRVNPWLTGGCSVSYVVSISVEDLDNAAPFTGAANEIYSRTYWGTTVEWTIPAGGLPADSWSESSDIAELIQHVIDKPGWSSGNYLSIAIWGVTDVGGCNDHVTDYSINPDNAAQLEVSYNN
jgi:hypothetical protein